MSKVLCWSAELDPKITLKLSTFGSHFLREDTVVVQTYRLLAYIVVYCSPNIGANHFQKGHVFVLLLPAKVGPSALNILTPYNKKITKVMSVEIQ